MKIDKRMTDDILALTKSKPEQLLEWFSYSYEKHKKYSYPCLKYRFGYSMINNYLNKYSFFLNHGESGIDGFLFRKKLHVKNDRNDNSIYYIWNYARESKENFNNITNQFKEIYNLKE